MVKRKEMIRKANSKDLQNLIFLEQNSFLSDQISERSFKHFIKAKTAIFQVLIINQELAGYGLILIKKGSALGRLYSIAVSRKHKGKGYGEMLLKALEEEAINKNVAYMRLEVDENNQKAIGLYKKLGYVKFAVKNDYYETHANALCFEKNILFQNSLRKLKEIKYYKQTTEFTCGPSCLMMAMNALNPRIKPTQSLEIKLWREATTIFMLKGHGGCGPRGLAISAKKRGFKSEIYLSTLDYLFLNSVRNESKQQIIKKVHQDFNDQIKDLKIPIKKSPINFNMIQKIYRSGGMILVLISAYQLTGTKVPHWIVISGVDDDFLYFHDPDTDEIENEVENQYVAIRKDEFNKICRYGSKQLQSAVVIYK